MMARKPLPIGTWGDIAKSHEGREKWVARARFRDDDGVTRKVEAWGKTGAAAERSLKIAMTQRAATTGADISSDTRLSHLADYWLRTEVDNSKRAINTKQRYRYVVETLVIPGVGGLLVREASVGALDRYIKRVTAETGAATAKLCKSVLSGMMTVAVRHGASASNTVRDISPIEVVHKEVRALSLEEVRQIRLDIAADNAATSVDLNLIVDVLLSTGARIGEVLAMRWQDLDLEDGTLSLNGTIVRVKGVGVIRQDTTKGRKVHRLRLPDFAVTLLKARASDKPHSEMGLVFPSVVGGMREVTTVEKQWRTFRTQHPEWAWVTPHTFRKTVGTLLERETGLAGASSQLGHSSEQVTKRHYVATSEFGPDHREILDQFST